MRGPVAGNGTTFASHAGSKKNAYEMRWRPRGDRTRCGVERYRPPVMRSSMSPTLQTSVSGTTGTSTQSSQPSGVADLQAAGAVLVQDREQAVVGVLGHPPGGRRRLEVGVDRRVAEDAEQGDRVGGEVLVEPAGVEAEAERDAPHEAMAERGHGVHPLEHRVPHRRQALGEEVRRRAAGARSTTRGSSGPSSAPK